MAIGKVTSVATSSGLTGKHGRSFLLTLVGSLFIACHAVTPEASQFRQSFSCATFGFSHWEEYNFGHDSKLEDLFVTVSRNFQVEQEQIQVEANYDERFLKATWTYSGIDFVAFYSIEQQGMLLSRIDVIWDDRQPTLARLVDCLGPPIDSHEQASDEGPASATMSYYWGYESDQEWPTLQGYVKVFMIEGVPSVTAETFKLGSLSEQRISRLTVLVLPTPRLAIESAGSASCRKLTLSHWKEFSFGVDTQDDVVSAVVGAWTLSRDQLHASGRTAERQATVSWNDTEGEVSHDAHFAEGRLDKILVNFDPMLALSQVLDCLGAPEYYVSSGGPTRQQTSLSLWYVEEGFVVEGSVPHPWGWLRPRKEILSDIGMYNLHIVPKGIPQMARLFDFQDGEGNPMMCFFQPWPGSIGAIEVREDPIAECQHSGAD